MFEFEYRGPVNMKGKKEPMITYFLASRKDQMASVNLTNHDNDTSKMY